LVLGSVLPVVPREDEAALEVMNYILGGGHFDTRLFREARDKRGLTNDASGFLEPAVSGPGTYTFRTYGRPGAVRLLLHLTLAEIERMRAAPVTEEELFVARGALADGVFAIRYRDGWATARSFAEEHARYGDPSWSDAYPERVRAVTAADVLSAARTYLHPERMTIVLVGPMEEIQAAPPIEGEGLLVSYASVVDGR
jgi:zinc protease